MKKIRIALAQISSKIGNVERNTEKHIQILSELQEKQVDFVAFPELSLTGYLMKDLAYEVALDCEKAIGKIAKRTQKGQRCMLGFVKEERQGFIQNAAAVTGDGEVLGTTSKFYLPTYGLFEEMRYFMPGNPKRDLKVFVGPECRFGVVICEDAWHPEPIEALARLGAEIVFCMASSPARGIHKADAGKEITIENQWYSLLKAHALMNTIFIAFVNRAGPEDEEYFWGGSMIVSPSGEIVSRAKRYEADLLTADIDMGETGRARRFSSFRDHVTEFHRILEGL